MALANCKNTEITAHFRYARKFLLHYRYDAHKPLRERQNAGFFTASLVQYPMLFFEHFQTPVIPPAAFALRLGRNIILALALTGISLLLGMMGYRELEGMGWTDAFLNAAMILGGMGPVSELNTEAGKWFAGCYALYSGLFVVVVAAIVLAPVVHRLLHKFHYDAD
jgi:hypothetical protein